MAYIYWDQRNPNGNNVLHGGTSLVGQQRLLQMIDEKRSRKKLFSEQSCFISKIYYRQLSLRGNSKNK